MNIVNSCDTEAILSQIDRLNALDSPVFGITQSQAHPEANIRAVLTSKGKVSLVVPFADKSGDFKKFGTTEIAGTSVAPDFRAHRDTRPSDVLNVHYVAKGPLTARFGLLPDELHDENLDLIPDFGDLEVLGYDTMNIRAETGITLCFLGGVATHGFESSNRDRLSVIQSFVIN